MSRLLILQKASARPGKESSPNWSWVIFNFGLKVFWHFKPRTEIAWLAVPTSLPPTESSWWPLSRSMLRGDRWTQTRKPNTSRVVRRSRPERRNDRGRGPLEAFCISNSTCQSGVFTQHITKLMSSCKKLNDPTFIASPWKISPLLFMGTFLQSHTGDQSHTLLFSLEQQDAGWCLSFCSLLFFALYFPFSFLYPTPRDVITPTDVSLHGTSTQKPHDPGCGIQNCLPKTKHACNFHPETLSDKQWPPFLLSSSFCYVLIGVTFMAAVQQLWFHPFLVTFASAGSQTTQLLQGMESSFIAHKNPQETMDAN